MGDGYRSARAAITQSETAKARAGEMGPRITGFTGQVASTDPQGRWHA